MAIQRIQDESGFRAVEVCINPGENIQCSRVQDGFNTDAYAFWFYEPTRELADNILAGKLIDADLIAGETVILRFEHSAAILPIVQDLLIIYGNLTKAGK